MDDIKKLREKQKKDNEELKKAQQIYEATFQEENGKIKMQAFVKGGTIDPSLKLIENSERGGLYLYGQNKKDQKQQSTSSMMVKREQPKQLENFFNQIKAKREISDKILKAQKLIEESNMEEESQTSEDYEQKTERQKANQIQSVFNYILRRQTHFLSENSRTLYIDDLSNEMSEQVLKEIYSEFNIENIQVKQVLSTEGTILRNIGYLKFQNSAWAQQCFNTANNKNIYGQNLTLKFGNSDPNDITLQNFSSEKMKQFNIDENNPKKIYVHIPDNPFQKKIINKLAKYVASEGCIVEQAIMEREINNPEFYFLFIRQSDEHIFYRWRVYAYLQGDSEKNWRLDPFQLYLGGPIWYPPLFQEKDETNIGNILEKDGLRDSERETAKKQFVGNMKLNDKEQQEFENILLSLNTKRISIANALIWAYEHSDKSAEMVLIIKQSIIQKSSSTDALLARLYLISDILHNSSLPSPQGYYWSFRMYLEHVLPDIFEALNQAYHDETDTCQSNYFKQKVIRILMLWNDWLVYDLKYLFGLDAILQKEKQHFLIEENGDHIFQYDLKSEKGIRLKILEEQLLQQSTFQLERQCRLQGLSIQGTKIHMIERILIYEELKFIKNLDADSRGIFENDQMSQRQLAINLIESYNQSFTQKNMTTQECEKKVKECKELLNILQKRYEQIDTNQIDGMPLDEVDYKFNDQLNHLSYKIHGQQLTPSEILKLDIEIDGLPLDEQDLQLIENKIYHDDSIFYTEEQARQLEQIHNKSDENPEIKELNNQIIEIKNFLQKADIYDVKSIDQMTTFYKEKIMHEKYPSIVKELSQLQQYNQSIKIQNKQNDKEETKTQQKKTRFSAKPQRQISSSSSSSSSSNSSTSSSNSRSRSRSQEKNKRRQQQSNQRRR